jgi:hypothetical protein
VGDQVRAQVGAQVGDQVWAQVWDQVRAQVGDQVWAQVRAQVGAQVWDQVRAQVGDQVGDQVYRACYGSQDAGWLSFYVFFGEVCGLEVPKKLEGLFGLARECGWWWPFNGAAILTELPTYLERDERNRLHSEHRAAIEYSDGWGVHAWHGVRVPADVILDPVSVTPARIAGESNQEIRRAMIERIGWDAYLRDAGAQEVQADRYGVLLEREEGGRLARFVRVKDASTARQYALGVPVSCKTAHEAVAWTFGLSTDEYQPEQET